MKKWSFRPNRLVSPLETDTSLTVIDTETIEAASVSHFEELVSLIPNMNLSGEGSRARYFQLRGVGEREQYEGAPNPSVGFFIDDIDLSGTGGVGSLFNMEQVEVLRGPQSARYGASALAGVVYMRSRDPVAESSLHAETNVGNDGLFSLGLAAGGALSENLNGQASIYHLQSNGFRDNAWFGVDNTHGRDELSLRGKLDWQFADGWSALLTGLYLNFDNGYDAWTVNNDDIVHSDHPGRDEQETLAGSLRIRGPLSDAVELVSITSLADTDVLFSFDGDWGNDTFWSSYGGYIYDFRYVNPWQRDNFNQELRLVSTPEGRWFNDTTDWVIGAFWQRLEERNQITSTGVYDDRLEENFCAPCLTDRRIQSDYEADTLAMFGTLDAQLNERLSLSLGLRFERWEARYQDNWQDINYPTVPPNGDSCSQFDCRPDDDLWGGHLSLSYQWRDGLHGYARIARGFKAGGFNPSLAALQGVAMLGPEFIAYRPEYLWNFEVGLKGLWLDDRLMIDLAVFYMDRDRAQLSQSSQQVEFDPNSFVFVTYNGEARVHGLEMALQWSLNDHWQLHGALGLQDSKIRDTASTRAVSPDAIDRDLAHAPAYTFNLGLSWQHQARMVRKVGFQCRRRFLL